MIIRALRFLTRLSIFGCSLLLCSAIAQDDFAPIDALHPLSATRSAMGEPSSAYWQQQVDYDIHVTLDIVNQRAMARATLRYHNRSPHTLNQLWFDDSAGSYRSGTAASRWRQSSNDADDVRALRDAQTSITHSGIEGLLFSDANHQPLSLTWYGNRARLQLKQPLRSGEVVTINARWIFYFIDRLHPSRPRFGVEQLGPSQWSFAAAQWYPQPVTTSDYGGLHTTPFLGHAEFNSELGDFNVTIDAPSDYAVVASGELVSRADKSLTAATSTSCTAFPSSYQNVAMNATNATTRRWRFRATQRRDFSWFASNGLRWQRACVTAADKSVVINLLYRDGDFLWQRFGGDAAQHAVVTLADYFGEFPFASMNIVNIAGISMEHPGLSFVGFRAPTLSDGERTPKYSRTEKYDVIAGILHEVAHSYFPMAVNVDETHEGFVDEGITSWLSFFLEQSWGRDFQSFYGEAEWQAESTLAYAPVDSVDHHDQKLEAHYHRPAAALNVLRETVLGRELFDEVVRGFYRQWKNKRATFSDLQRYFNAHSGHDLAWFWRSWFYQSTPLTLTLESAQWALESASEWNASTAVAHEQGPFIDHDTLTRERDRNRPTLEERLPQLNDIYSRDPHFISSSTPAIKPALAAPALAVLRLTLVNDNHVVTPVPVRLTYADATVDDVLLPAESWRQSALPGAQKLVVFLPVKDASQLMRVEIDPRYQLPLTSRAALLINAPFSQTVINAR